MRIHIGHHFYGAGNLGDDFMLAGFLGAMRDLVPDASFTCAVPFPLGPLRQRFPQVDWRPYADEDRATCIANCDAWLGLGGSPFQCAQSRWFIDHLVSDAAQCRLRDKPMFFLGVGVQTDEETQHPDVQAVCAQAEAIWTRDSASSRRLGGLASPARVRTGADLAHVFFYRNRPPQAQPGRLTAVLNFDYAGWPGQAAFLRAAETLGADERVWLAQEARELPGAEKAMHALLSGAERATWRLIDPEVPGEVLGGVLGRWPSGEWLITSRHHAALAAAWSGSRVIVITTNAKLEATADELQTPALSIDATEDAVRVAFRRAPAVQPPIESANRAFAMCAEFCDAIRRMR